MAWTNSRCPWTDKFNRPTVDELRASFAKPMQRVLEDAREALAPDGVAETLSWQGVPWRWSLVYRYGSGPDADRPLAYLIPDPERLQVCVPLTKEQIDALPMKRLRKSIRDGVTHARSVAGVWWATWDVPGRGALDEVVDLVERKHKLIVGEGELARA